MLNCVGSLVKDAVLPAKFDVSNANESVVKARKRREKKKGKAAITVFQKICMT